MAFEISWAADSISAKSEVTDSQAVLQLYEGLRQTIDVGEERHVQLDFEACEDLAQAVMLPLLPQIVRYQEMLGTTFSLRLPDPRGTLFQSSLNALFANTNWAHFI